jgi:anti-sigma B factor antagonist
MGCEEVTMDINVRDARASLPAARNGYVPAAHLIVHLGGGAVVVEIIGEHDLASHDSIRDLFTMLLDTNSLVVVDVSATTFIDSSFLRALVKANKHADEVGSRLRLQVGTAPSVRQVLEISGLTKYLDCVYDREEALP